jgi:N-acetylglucosaminyldiphosphoundecaprenol N-acetyl-beta-D-mannosaminyltransferase
LYSEAIRQRWGIYCLGGASGTASSAAGKLTSAYPGLKIVGTHHGYFSSEEEQQEVIDDINQTKAVIVLVGMGQPRQEEWIVASKGRIRATILVAVGGYFEHVLKRVDCYPAWVYKWRLNWAYRLLREPKRLWKRYTLGILTFGMRVLWAKVAGGR